MKINFKEFPIYTSIRKDMVQNQDISFLLSNSIYTSIPGIQAHAFALKVYGAEGEIELSGDETDALLKWVEMFSGIIADSIKDYITKKR